MVVILLSLMPVPGCQPAESDERPLGQVSGALEEGSPLSVEVFIDGEPAPNTPVVQGGKTERVWTDKNGIAVILFDPDVFGDLFVMASHPEARIGGTYVSEGDSKAQIFLERYPTEDNPEYEFKKPGEPGNSLVHWECGHCHLSINADFTGTVHSLSLIHI